MPAESLPQLHITTHSTDATQRLGEMIGRILQPGDVIGLTGNLGAGKTTFTQGIGAGLGVRGYMRSPTFTLVNEYDLDDGGLLYHLDGYRLGETLDEAMLEAESFGMDQLFDEEEAIIIVEWADRVASLLPDDRLQVEIADGDNEEARRFTFRAGGPRSRAILKEIEALTT